MERLWPFAVNWSEGFHVTYEFWTEIIESRSGREQRICSRAVPRKTFEFQSLVKFATRRRFDGFVAAWQNKPVVIPDVTRYVVTTEAVGAGELSIDMSEITSWIDADLFLVLEKPIYTGDSRVERELIQVESVAGSTVNLLAPVVGDFPLGSKVYQGILGRFDDSLKSTDHTDLVAEVSVTFRAEPGQQPDEDNGVAGEVFNGREIFPFSPNWGDGVSTDYEFPVDELDYNRGLISYKDPIDFLSRTRRASFIVMSKEEAEAIRAFFCRMLGRQDEFYLPSGSDDIPLKEAAAAGAVTFKTAGTDFSEDYGDDTVYRALAVEKTDGTTFYVQVLTVTDDGTDTIFTLATALPAGGISPETVRRISWMPVCRFGADSLTIEWITDSVATVMMAVKTLEDLAGE